MLGVKRSTNVFASQDASGESITLCSHYEATEELELLGRVLPSKPQIHCRDHQLSSGSQGLCFSHKQKLYRFCHTEPVFQLFLPLLMPSACLRHHRAILSRSHIFTSESHAFSLLPLPLLFPTIQKPLRYCEIITQNHSQKAFAQLQAEFALKIKSCQSCKFQQ